MSASQRISKATSRKSARWINSSAGPRRMADESILIDKRAGYRVITLNRPDKLNAFNEAMHEALGDAIADAEADESCRALMITGSGKAFCAGQDLNDRLPKPGETIVL